MTSSIRVGHHRYRLMVLAGSGALMVALPLLADDSPAAVLVVGIAGPVLILGLLFALGPRPRSGTPGSGGCHAAAAMLLQDAKARHLARSRQTIPRSVLTSGNRAPVELTLAVGGPLPRPKSPEMGTND
jgi:hypothetical protein